MKNLKEKHIILLLLISVYIINQRVISGFGFNGIYIFQPIIWILLSLIGIKYARKININVFGPGPRYVRRLEISPLLISTLIGVFQISIGIIFGLFMGFGKSPYSFTPIMILANIFFLGSSIIALEITRTFLVRGRQRDKKLPIKIGSIAILYSFFTIYNKISLTSGLEEQVKLAGIFSVALAQNILAAYMAYLGGAYASISYFGIIQGSEFFMPYLPKFSWEFQTFLGIITPTVGFMATQNLFEEKKSKRIKDKEDISPGWIITGILIVLMIWSFSGILGFHPTVVGSGSMRPLIDAGDVAIIVNADAKDIKVGDIVQIKFESYNVLHRVIEINSVGDTIYFKTKGDANEEADKDLAEGPQITGKMSFSVPKIGLIGMVVRNSIKEVIKSV